MPTRDEVSAFMAREFPQSRSDILALGDGGATVRRRIGEGDLRPGGTVSGPVMFEVADVALYVALLGEVGLVPLAVTTSLTINFLRKPAAGRDLIGVCRLIKTGRVLVVGDVTVYSEGTDEPVAHAVGTYSVPPARQAVN